jgi:cell division initiation protein
MRITPLDIRQREFKTSFKGYNIKEVQDFLLDLAAEYESLIDDHNNLGKEREEQQTLIDEYRKDNEKIKDVLLAAQELNEERKAISEREADHIIKDAKLQAEEIHRQTRLSLEKIEKEIEDLKLQKVKFQTKLKSLIESHLKMLEVESSEQNEEKEVRKIQALKDRR